MIVDASGQQFLIVLDEPAIGCAISPSGRHLALTLGGARAVLWELASDGGWTQLSAASRRDRLRVLRHRRPPDRHRARRHPGDRRPDRRPARRADGRRERRSRLRRRARRPGRDRSRHRHDALGAGHGPGRAPVRLAGLAGRHRPARHRRRRRRAGRRDRRALDGPAALDRAVRRLGLGQVVPDPAGPGPRAAALAARHPTAARTAPTCATSNFNAWQFADANLWASLATHILDAARPARTSGRAIRTAETNAAAQFARLEQQIGPEFDGRASASSEAHAEAEREQARTPAREVDLRPDHRRRDPDKTLDAFQGPAHAAARCCCASPGSWCWRSRSSSRWSSACSGSTPWSRPSVPWARRARPSRPGPSQALDAARARGSGDADRRGREGRRRGRQAARGRRRSARSRTSRAAAAWPATPPIAARRATTARS